MQTIAPFTPFNLLFLTSPPPPSPLPSLKVKLSPTPRHEARGVLLLRQKERTFPDGDPLQSRKFSVG